MFVNTEGLTNQTRLIIVVAVVLVIVCRRRRDLFNFRRHVYSEYYF